MSAPNSNGTCSRCGQDVLWTRRENGSWNRPWIPPVSESGTVLLFTLEVQSSGELLCQPIFDGVIGPLALVPHSTECPAEPKRTTRKAAAEEVAEVMPSTLRFNASVHDGAGTVTAEECAKAVEAMRAKMEGKLWQEQVRVGALTAKVHHLEDKLKVDLTYKQDREIKLARRLAHPCPLCKAKKFEWCTFVDNAVNRNLGNVGMRVKTMHSERPGAQA